MKSPSDCARDSDWMIHIVIIVIVIIIIIILFISLFLFGAQRRSTFSKVSHHLGVYFLRFVGLLYGESRSESIPRRSRVCVCVG